MGDYNGDPQQAYQQFQNHPHHEAKLSHELLGGAAGWAAVTAYEKHLRDSGEQPSHAKFKEFLGAVGGFGLDKLLEGKGRDFYDKEYQQHAHKHAEREADKAFQQKFGNQ